MRGAVKPPGRASTAVLLLLAIAYSGGCGYTVSARPGLPGGVSTLSVPIFENDTPETEVGVIMAAALADRARSEGRLSRRGAGEARLLGRIELVRAVPVAFPAAAQGAGMYALSLQVRLRLVPAPGGTPIIELVVSGREQYLAGRTPEETEALRRLALERLCERPADEAWGRLTAP
jgi:hypothetical protein